MTNARELSNRERRFSLSGEPDRGLAASRRPFGDVRISGSPDRWRVTPAEQCSASKPPYRKSHTNQPTTKVSTLSQDLTRLNSSGEGGLALYDTMAVYYQVSFDSNGGNGSAIAENGCVTKDNGDGTTNRYYEVGTLLTLPSGEGVTRGGFAFEGWTVDGDDTVYAPGDTYPVEMSPIVFKAKWTDTQDVEEPSAEFLYELVNGNAIITNYTGTSNDVIFPAVIDGHPVTEIAANAFYHDTYPFVNVTISEGIQKIGPAAFGPACADLETLSIPSTLTTFGTSNGSEFLGCSAIRSVNVADGNPNYKSVDGVLYNKAGTTLIYCPASKDPNGAFVVPASVTYIAEYAFCFSKFKTVTLPETITKIEESVFWFANLTSMVVPSGVSSIGRWAFDGCSALTSVTIPPSVTSIGDYAFSYCNALKTVYVSPGDAQRVASLYSFDNSVEFVETGDSKPDWKEQIVVMPYKQSVFVRIYDVTTKSYLEHAEGMLAAFAANGECRGCTTLLNGPVCKLFQLSVGIESETEKEFTLKYWNPQTGVIDVREGFDANANKKIGAINAPETYHVGEIEFELTMKSGWNWISIPVKPSDISIGSVFGGFAFSDEDSIMSADGTATYYAGQWYSGDFDAIVPGAGYCVHKGTAGGQVVTVSGEAIANSAAVRSGWNWIGCPSVSEIGLSDVSHSAGFADEDEINSADGIAVCYSGMWYSSDFDVLEPGAAYIAKLARTGMVTFGVAKAMSPKSVGMKSCLMSSKGVGAAPTWKEEIVIQPESLSLFCKIKKGDADELIETEGSMLGVFAANGECRGATTILTVPNVGTFFQLKVGAANTLESGFTLKVWDASTGKTYDVDGSFGFGDCTGDKKIGSFTSPVTKIAVVAQPIPPLPQNPTAEDVKNALDGSADARLQECITEPTVYNAYRAWAETVKVSGGSTAAGAQAVKDSPNAWLSFALDSATLISNPPADGDVKVEMFEQTATAGSFDFIVSVKDVQVGDDANPGNLAKVFGIEGGSTLSPQDMSSDKVDITFGAPENGKVKFTAGPKDKTQPSFFMRVMMK